MNSVSNDNNVKSIKRQNSRKVIPDEKFAFINDDDDYNKCYCFSMSCIVMLIIVIVLLVLLA